MNKAEFTVGWRSGQPETPCGAGSKFDNTHDQREWIPRMVSKYGITSIADLGCGDLNWARWTDFGCEYTPYDLIPRTDGVIKLDILEDGLPDADCHMVLWVVNHLTADQAMFATKKIMSSNARYLIATWHPNLYNFMNANVIESIEIDFDAHIRLIEL